MSGQHSGKVALVTGGSSGIGRSTALEFAKEGAIVVIAALREQEGQEVVAQIKDLGGQAAFFQTDISVESQVSALMDSVVEKFGRVDCAFNNAGTSVRGMLHEFREEDWDRVLDINLKGMWSCMK